MWMLIFKSGILFGCQSCFACRFPALKNKRNRITVSADWLFPRTASTVVCFEANQRVRVFSLKDRQKVLYFNNVDAARIGRPFFCSQRNEAVQIICACHLLSLILESDVMLYLDVCCRTSLRRADEKGMNRHKTILYPRTSTRE